MTPDEKKARKAANFKAWAAKNRERILVNKKRFYAAHKEQRCAEEKARRIAQPLTAEQKARQAQTAAARYQANPDRFNAASVAWARNNSEKSRALRLAWAAANPEKTRAAEKKYNEANPEKRAIYLSRGHVNRKSRVENAGTFTLEEWNALLDETGHQCIACGIPEAQSIYRYPRAGFALTGKLTIDHIVPLSKGGSGTIDNVAPLCLPCNMRKHNRDIAYHPKRAAAPDERRTG